MSDVIREIRIPIAKAMRRIGKPFEIAIGTPPQGLFGSRGLVLKCLQLETFIRRLGEIAVFRAALSTRCWIIGTGAGLNLSPRPLR